jgi:hypothetical protein
MTPRFRVLVSAIFLLGAGAFAQAAPPHHPAGTPPWTVSLDAIGPASLVGHGTAIPVSQAVNDGGTATVTITPDPGYVLTSVDLSETGGAPNGDGTWTTDQIYNDCAITATFALSPADVIFQGDLDPDITVFDDVNLDLPQTWLGASINWQTGATCTGTNTAPCDNTYHFRVASSYNFTDPVLVFRFPTNDDEVVDDSLRSYGVVGYSNPSDEEYSTPLQSGATIGPEQTFVFPVLDFETAPWQSPDGLDAYVGFRFLNSGTGRINYGYAHLITSPQSPPAPATGFPATIVSFAYNRRGDAITIP